MMSAVAKGIEEALKHPELLEAVGDLLLTGRVSKAQLLELLKAEITKAVRDDLAAELDR